MHRGRFTSNFIDLEGGFWGLTNVNGDQFMIVNMPEQLKTEGKEFTVTLRIFEGASMAMWGTPAEVVGFSTS